MNKVDVLLYNFAIDNRECKPSQIDLDDVKAEVANLIKAEAPAELLPMLNNACADVRLMYRQDRLWREAVDRVLGIEKEE